MILTPRLGTLAASFLCLFEALGPDPGPLLRLFRKRFEKGTKNERKTGAIMDAFSLGFRVFLGNGKVRFDCAGVSGSMSRPLFVLLRAFIFGHPFFASLFLRFLEALWEPGSMRSS